MNRILFLDDDHSRHLYASEYFIGHDAYHAYTVAEAVFYLKNVERFDLAFLDHDLGGEQMFPSGPGTGTEVAEFISHMGEEDRPKVVVVHSYSPAGAKRMVEVLRGVGIPSTWAPFGPGTFNLLITGEEE